MKPYGVLDGIFDDHWNFLPNTIKNNGNETFFQNIDGHVVWCYDIEDIDSIWICYEVIKNCEVLYYYGSIKDHIFYADDSQDHPHMITIVNEGLNRLPDRVDMLWENTKRNGPFGINIKPNSGEIQIMISGVEISWDSKWNKKYDLFGKDFCRNSIDKIALAALLHLDITNPQRFIDVFND